MPNHPPRAIAQVLGPVQTAASARLATEMLRESRNILERVLKSDNPSNEQIIEASQKIRQELDIHFENFRAGELALGAAVDAFVQGGKTAQLAQEVVEAADAANQYNFTMFNVIVSYYGEFIDINKLIEAINSDINAIHRADGRTYSDVKNIVEACRVSLDRPLELMRSGARMDMER